MAEPFSGWNPLSEYRDNIADLSSLFHALDDIWKTYNGIKHIWNSSGWPFCQCPELNKHLLVGRDHNVIFLNRRNYLRRLVSQEISTQTGIWGFFTDAERRRVEEFSYMPLKIEYLRAELRKDMASISDLRNILIETSTTYLELWYEDLFGSGLSIPERVVRLAHVLAFIGAAKVNDDAVLSSMTELLDPTNEKLNSSATYLRIPNIDEIERALGSDSTGWLFQEADCDALSVSGRLGVRSGQERRHLESHPAGLSHGVSRCATAKGIPVKAAYMVPRPLLRLLRRAGRAVRARRTDVVAPWPVTKKRLHTLLWLAAPGLALLAGARVALAYRARPGAIQRTIAMSGSAVAVDAPAGQAQARLGRGS